MYRLEGKDLIPRKQRYNQEIIVQYVYPHKNKEIDKNYSHLFGDPFKDKDFPFEELLNLLCKTAAYECLYVQELWAYAYALIHYGDKYPFDKVEFVYGFTEESLDYGVALDVFWRYKE